MKNEVYYLSMLAETLDRRLEEMSNSLKSLDRQFRDIRNRVENMAINREAGHAKGDGQSGLEILEKDGKEADSEGQEN